MSENDSRHGSADGEKCGAETNDGSSCQLPADSCPHHDSSSAESSSEDSHAELPSTDREFYETHGGMLLSLKGREARDDETVGTSAARMILKHTDASGSQWAEVFDSCAVEGCDRGCNGFDTDYCGKPSHSPSETEEDSSTDEGSSDTSSTSDDVEERVDELENKVDQILEAVQ